MAYTPPNPPWATGTWTVDVWAQDTWGAAAGGSGRLHDAVEHPILAHHAVHPKRNKSQSANE